MKIAISFLSLCIGILPIITDAKEHNTFKEWKWGNLPVVYVPDDSIPVFNVTIYFSDGSLSDQDPAFQSGAGVASLMFEQLFFGTNRYSQSEISDHLDYFGASFGASTGHDHSKIQFSGLVKDIVPITKMICHVITDASFPMEHLNNSVSKRISSLNNITQNSNAMASLAFNRILYKNTALESPTHGTKESLQKIKREQLIQRLNYFRNTVSKKIFITGPKHIEELKSLLVQDCGINNSHANFERKISLESSKSDSHTIYFVPHKNSKQATVILGRIQKDQKEMNPIKLLTSTIFGGGNSNSILMEELRNKNGLTYGVYSSISPNKEFFTTTIHTTTANNQLLKLLSILENTMNSYSKGEFSQEQIERSRLFLLGQYLFGLEKSSDFLEAIIDADYLNRPYSNIINFSSRMKNVQVNDVYLYAKNIYDYGQFVKLIVAHPDLEPEMKKNFSLKVLDITELL